MTVKNALSDGYSGGSGIVGFEADSAPNAALLKGSIGQGPMTLTSVSDPSLCTKNVMTTRPFIDIAAYGTISDLNVVGPCPIDAFNNAAVGALAGSNPTQPLPPEYPADKAFFTVTFFYNEAPPR